MNTLLKIPIIKVLREGYIKPKGCIPFYRVEIIDYCYGELRVNTLDYTTKEMFDKDRKRGYYVG